MLVFLLIGAVCFPQHDLAIRPLRTIYEKDVDRDGKVDKLVYEVREFKDNYEGSLIITSAERRTLWEHRWVMSKSDLSELIETEGEVTNKKSNLESWVAKFFSGGLNYGARFETRKLKASELGDEERLANFAKYYRVSVASIKKSILSQKANSLMSYRAEWREDLNLLVYVPSIRKFVCYQRGY
jgi:hypothetical protein